MLREMAPPSAGPSDDLRVRLEALGRELGRREAAEAAALADAWRHAEAVRARVADALGGLHDGLAAAGASHLRLQLGPLRLDEKHVRAVQFEVARGRTQLLVTVKSRGEVVLVGPFRTGKEEGPCQRVPWDDQDALSKALLERLAKLAEEALAP